MLDRMFRSAQILVLVLAASAPARAIEPLDSAPALIASYETQIWSGKRLVRSEHWTLTRSHSALEYRWDERGVSELWERDPDGQITHARHFRADATVVRYTQGDLNTLAIMPDWAKLSSVVLPPDDEQHAHATQSSFMGKAALQYTTQDAEARKRVTWLPGQRVLAELVSKSRQSDIRVRVRLVKLSTPELVQNPFARLPECRLIDFADLGDMEYDPFVKKLVGHTHLDAALPDARAGLASPVHQR